MEDFVTFEIAKILKEKGFREKCLLYYESTGGFYSNSIDTYDRPNQELDYSDFLKCFNEGNSIGLIDAPTISQVLKWLREEKKIFVTINIGYCYESDEIPFPTNPKMEPILKGYYYGTWELDNLNDKNGHSEYFETPELAALAGIKYILNNLI